MLLFNKNYFGLAVLVFCLEVLIALYIHDRFIRPYFGDVLVVILIYCFLKAFVKIKVLTAAILVLLFAFTIEFLQFWNVVERLGWQNSKLARTVVGTSFSWEDLLCYVAGIIMVLAVERYRLKK